jgi:hypothetical protein
MGDQMDELKHAAQTALQSSEYSFALLEALSDYTLTDDEMERLRSIREAQRLSHGQVRAVHSSVLQWALGQFAGDGDLDESEMIQLSKIIDCLRLLGWAPGDRDMGFFFRKSQSPVGARGESVPLATI